MTEALVRIDGVSKSFGSFQAVKNVSLTIDPRILADWKDGGWTMPAGEYTFALGKDAETLGTQLAVHLLRKYASVSYRDAGPVGPLSPSRLRRLEEFVETHLHEAISIEQMAHVAGLGVWTFTRHFRATVGRAPHEFVLDRRVFINGFKTVVLR